MPALWIFDRILTRFWENSPSIATCTTHYCTKVPNHAIYLMFSSFLIEFFFRKKLSERQQRNRSYKMKKSSCEKGRIPYLLDIHSSFPHESCEVILYPRICSSSRRRRRRRRRRSKAVKKYVRNSDHNLDSWASESVESRRNGLEELHLRNDVGEKHLNHIASRNMVRSDVSAAESERRSRNQNQGLRRRKKEKQEKDDDGRKEWEREAVKSVEMEMEVPCLMPP